MRETSEHCYISFSEGETSEHRFISSIEEEPQNTLISHALKNLWTSLCLIQLGGTSEHRFISFIEKEPQNTVIYHSLKGDLRGPLCLIYWVRTPSYLIHWEELQNTNISQSWKRNLWTHLSFIEDNPKNTVPPRLCITSHGYSISVIWS